MRHCTWTVCLLAILAAATAWAAEGGAAAGNRWAVVIGVDDYSHMTKLQYAGADARGLAEQLQSSGFPADHVYLLHDKAEETRYRPLKSNIEKHVELVLKLAEKDDLVVVAFGGSCPFSHTRKRTEYGEH